MINKYRKDFPIFKKDKSLIYLDSASTSQIPNQVINSVVDFYENQNSNPNRGIYKLSEAATNSYNKARDNIARFINAQKNEIVFTRNTTESINLLAYTIKNLISKGKDEIVLTEMEHHSNLIPWQQLSKREGFKIKLIKIKPDFTLDLEDAKQKINNNTAIVSLSHISNVTGTINNIEKIIDIAKENKALTIIDAAQSIPHLKLNVKKLNCDFLAFSAHKIFAPSGIGVLYGKSELLEKLPPLNFGGGMINSVEYEDSEFSNPPEKFEAGVQNIAGSIGLSEAINYLEKIGFENIEKYEKDILKYTLNKLKLIRGIKIYNPPTKEHSSIISFNLKGIHPHDVGALLAEKNICVRAGHHCCMPLMKKLNIPGSLRISLAFYNSKEEIDKTFEELKRIQEIFENE